MTRVLIIHGIGQQYKGPRSVESETGAALIDGVTLAGGSLRSVDVESAFYGDLFRPQGEVLGGNTADTSMDLEPEDESLLLMWWRRAAEIDPRVVPPDQETLFRSPRVLQSAILALSRSRFFSGLGSLAMIGNLKQLSRYFGEAQVRADVQQRVKTAISSETTVIVAHSMGSIVGYELLCSDPKLPVRSLVTLGSPLGMQHLVFERLSPPPVDGRAAWPKPLTSWTNVADVGDVVAVVEDIRPLYGQRIRQVRVHNGANAHSMAPYLTARETGLAIWEGVNV